MSAFASRPNVQVQTLESKAFASGGTVSIPTAGALPIGRRVRQVIFRLDVAITQPAAASAAQQGAVLHQLISQIKIGRRISITGLGLYFLNWAMRGQSPSFPPGFPATNDGVFTRSITWALDYCDLSSKKPEDSAIPSELWTDPIEVRFGTTAIFAATVPVSVVGTLRTFVVHDAAAVASNGRQLTVPSSLNIQTDDFSALTAIINKPGLWAYAVLFREASNDAGQVTSANLTNAIVSVDGTPILNSLRVEDIATVFNQMRANTAAFRNDTSNGVAGTLPIPGTPTNTAPPHVPGGLVMDEPGSATAAGAGVTCDFVPLIVPPWNYHLSMLAMATNGFRLDATGTLAAYKIAYRLIERRPDQAVANAARRLGIAGMSKFGPKVGDNSIRDNPELAHFLPYTVQE